MFFRNLIARNSSTPSGRDFNPCKQVKGVQNGRVGTSLGALSRTRNSGWIKGLVLVCPSELSREDTLVFVISIVASTNVFT